MSKKEKLLSKIKDGPRNVRMNDLVTLMEGLGFTKKPTNEGYAFLHEELTSDSCNIPMVANPHGREKKVKKCYVDACLDAIKHLNIPEEKNE